MNAITYESYRASLNRPEERVRKSDGLLAEPLRDGFNLILAVCVTLLITVVFALLCPDLLGWFVIPVALCGCLSGIDMMGWLRRQVDLFDPLGILGAFGFYFFFLAPLLTVGLDYHTLGIPQVPDWADWIGFLSIINAVGLLIYMLTRRLIPVRQPKKVWAVRPVRFFTATAIALPITLTLQIFIFIKFGGGVEGFAETFTSSIGTNTFQGLGYLFLLAETFPIFAAIAYFVWARDFLKKSPWLLIILSGFIYFLLKLVCGGLRGSRGLTVWGMVWFVGAVHAWIRPVPRKTLIFGFVFIIVFMYFYGFYKDVGVEALDALGDPSQLAQMERRSGRTLPEVLLGDMARTDVQTALLYRTSTANDYQRAYGLDYVESFAFVIPRAIWPDRPEGKVRWGTEAMFGERVFTWETKATYIYGLVGEGLLNFPAIVVPILFLGVAFVVTSLRSVLLLDQADLRRLLLPVCSILVIMMVCADLENVLFLSLSIAVAPLILILACTEVRPRPESA